MHIRQGYSSSNARFPSKALTAFVLLYMLVFSIFALQQGNTEFLMYSLVMVIFIVGTVGIHLRVRFSSTALWLLAIWGFMHMAGGTIGIDPSLTDAFRAAATDADRPESAVLYSLRLFPNLPRYDQVVHTFGFFSAAVACYEALRVLLDARASFAAAVVAVLMSIGLGAINEIVEFIAVLTIPDTNVGGYTNTAWDLVCNTIGATTAGLWMWVRRAP